jgi:hypothetical protein
MIRTTINRNEHLSQNIDDHPKILKVRFAKGCRKYNLHIEDRMTIVPVPFSIEGAKMLQHAKWLMEETEGRWQQSYCYSQG